MVGRDQLHPPCAGRPCRDRWQTDGSAIRPYQADKRTAPRSVPINVLGPAQRKPVVRRFPQTQSNKLLVQTIIDLWPKCADNVFSSW